MRWILLLLILHPVHALVIEDAHIHESVVITEPTRISRSIISANPAFIVQDKAHLQLTENTFTSEYFMELQCQEDTEQGLTNCSDMNLTLHARNNNFIGTQWIIYSDEVPTESIFLNRNYYSLNNPFEPRYNFERNHDLFDYQARRTPYNQPQRLKTLNYRMVS